MFFQRYEDLGGTPSHLVVTFLANPVYVLRVLLVSARLGGLGVLIAPMFLALCCRGPYVVILLIPLLINSLSSFDQQYGFRIHYTMLPMVIVYTAAVYGVNNQGETRQRDNCFSPIRLGAFSVVTSLVLFVLLSPLGLRALETLRRFEIHDHHHIGHRILKNIPRSASVVAQDTLAPHISQREYITLFPQRLAEEPDYYVFDVTGHLYPLSPAEYHKQVAQIIKNPDYGPVCVKDGYIVLKKGAKRTLVPEALQVLNTKGP